MEKEKKKFYITTALPYVNAKPHVGFAYEIICADVIARWHHLLEEDIFFLTGTDENAKKNELAAREAKIPVKKFVDTNARAFFELCKKLNISNDDFIRTTQERHVKVAQFLFKKIYEKGEIYKGTYKGFYCIGCEAFLTEKDLVDGKCPEHNTKPEFLEEESYFFKLSKYKKEIEKVLSKKGFVLPYSRQEEMLSRLKEGIRDLSVSRINQEWGIDVPINPRHKIYVWIDALSNYISALDWPEGKRFERYWPADLHIVGKGITWFHAVIWPALLMAIGLPLSKQIFVHGYLTVDGKKISKSLGNVIDPIYIVNKYNTDALRYFLVREIPFGQDGDFNEKALKQRYNTELADKLGNLVNRIVGLAEKFFKGRIPQGRIDDQLVDQLQLEDIKKHMEKLELDKALALIFAFIDSCNLYIQEKRPWDIPWEIPPEPDSMKKISNILYTLIDSLRVISILLSPFMPNTAKEIATQLGVKLGTLNDCKFGLTKATEIKKARILFEKIKD